VSRPPAVRVERPRRLSRQDRARAVLACLSRVMRPLSCGELAERLGLTVERTKNAIYHDARFGLRDGRYWITEAGWRERLAGHPCTRGE
jgi:hypothetical protein